MTTSLKEHRLAYSLAELRELTRLSRSTIHKEINEGRLKARKVGRRTIVLVEDAQAWIASMALLGDGGAS